MYLALSWVCARPDNAQKCQGIKFVAHQRMLHWFAICLKLDSLLLIGFNYGWFTGFVQRQQASRGSRRLVQGLVGSPRPQGSCHTGQRIRCISCSVSQASGHLTSPVHYGINQQRTTVSSSTPETRGQDAKALECGWPINGKPNGNKKAEPLRHIKLLPNAKTILYRKPLVVHFCAYHSFLISLEQTLADLTRISCFGQ